MAHPEIVDGRIVEAFFPADQMDPGILRKLSVIPEDLFGAAVILHNDDLVIFVGSFFKNGFHASLKRFFLLTVRNDNRNQRFSLHRILHTVKSKIRSMLHGSRSSGPFEIPLNGTSAGFKSIHLACRIICCGGFMGPPVIKDLRYMDHFPGLLHTAENEIIILGAVKFPAESAHCLHYGTSYHQKMADIIIGS